MISPNLKKRIMRRVYFIWLWRYFVKDILSKAALILFFVWLFKEAVFVQSVIDNFTAVLQSPGSLANFITDALVKAGPLVLGTFFGASLLSLFLIKDLARIGAILQPRGRG